MEGDVQALLNKESIIETISRLFVATDSRDWATVRDCFAPQVLFDMRSMGQGDPATVTPERIAAAWEEGLRPLQAIHHQAGNHLVRLGDREAVATCHGIALHHLPNPTGRNTRAFVGTYEFHLAKSFGVWRIDRLRFDLKFIEGNPELESS